MSLSNTALPPLAKISMIGIWVETVLYGINCTMYGLCLFVLLHGQKTVGLRWVLMVMSTILFLLCTVHVGTSLRQLLDAFVYAPADVPDYATLYFLNFSTTPRVLKDNLYISVVLVQHVILIWRLYVVFMYDWRVIILPVIMMNCCAASAYAASALSIPPGDKPAMSSSFLISAWVFGFTLNVSVTTAIAGRFWWIARTMASLTATTTNRFASSIYVAIESGAITAALSAVILALYVNPLVATGLDVATQLVALGPFLIIVQVGVTSRYRISTGVIGGQDSPGDRSLHTIQFRLGSGSA